MERKLHLFLFCDSGADLLGPPSVCPQRHTSSWCRFDVKIGIDLPSASVYKKAVISQAIERAFIYSSKFADCSCSYGEDHPFKILRFCLTYDLVRELGLFSLPGVGIVEAESAPESALLSFHRPDYLETLSRFSLDDEPRANFFYGLGDVENPVFKGLYDWSRLVCGATLTATRLVAESGLRLAFNMAGGWHHAQPARASGFSYLNDSVVAIHHLVEQGFRVAYVDIDAHHGDAVQSAFYDTDRVLTLSLHEWAKDFYPNTGAVEEFGLGRGYGYSINVPLAPHADDLVFEQAFRRVVLPLLKAYRPDILFTQLGVDSLRTDPLTRLEFTTGALEFAARSFLATGLPWIAVGGGGYDKFNVARSWALIWAIMAGADVPDRLPAGYLARATELGESSPLLRDRPRLSHPDDFSRAQASLDRTIRIIEQKIFPLYGLRTGG